MNNQYNWNEIKRSLMEDIIEPDFQNFSNSAFNGIDFDKVLEIFRFILELKNSKHDETNSVFIQLSQYANGIQKKEILDILVTKYEVFLKKVFSIIKRPIADKGLSKGYNYLFDKLNIVHSNSRVPTIRDEFYETILVDGIKTPKYDSNHFCTMLSDNTAIGKSLHSAYHLRNSYIHNDPHLSTRKIPEFIVDCLVSYIYFISKFYNELTNEIDDSKLDTINNAIVFNLAALSGGAYNPIIFNEVNRENIILTIEKKLLELDVLFIEGEEGIGKTAILHQFVAKHPNNCFAYFIDSKDSNTFTNLSILKSFCNQLHFINRGSSLEEIVDVNNYSNEDWLKDYLSTEKIRNKTNQVFYFVIDGLDEISQDRQYEIKEQILDKLPYDKHNIKLILTGGQNKNILKNNCSFDKFEIPFLAKNESYNLFKDSITIEQFDKINEFCKNNLGKIVFFRDLVNKSGFKIENLIEKLSTDIRDVYQYLWSLLPNENENIKIILSIIAFQDEKYESKKIAKILDFDERYIIDSLNGLPFVKKNTKSRFEFIFDGFANFARTKLPAYNNKIDKIVINYLLNNLESLDSLIQLPELYKKTGKKDDLLKLLTSERWNQLLITSEKISVVSRVSNVALETIQNENENKYIPTILKYSLLKSALNELGRTTVWQYEIATSLVLGDYIVAGNLANMAFLKEDKLKMFASIAKAYVERKDKVPNNIKIKIEELYEDIDASKDFKNIKESAVEIAALLMYTNPKLAFRLIEDLSGTITDNDNAFDWALAQISMSVQTNIENIEDVSKEDLNSKVYSKIRNPKIKEFADAIIYLSENQTSEQIIEKISQLESTSQKMFLIRNWIRNNQKDQNISIVIELGLELIVNKSDKYVPKSEDYKVLSLPLPYLNEKGKTYELISKIEQYTDSIQSNSATNDLLAIRLFMARAYCNFDFELGEEKLFEIYSEIEKIADMAIKCTCLAIYANEATKILKIHTEKNLDMYLDSAREDIKNSIDKILEQTASHFEIVQSIITNLVRLYPADAILICGKLNKSIDRDNAFLESLATYLKQSIDKVNPAIIDGLLTNIVDLDIQIIAISEIVNRLENTVESEKQYLPLFSKYFERIDVLIDNRAKCLLYVKVISILDKVNSDFSEIESKLYKTWDELEKSVHKIELGYEIAYNAAFLTDDKIAKEFLSFSNLEKNSPVLLLDSPNTAEVLNLIIELTVRLFSGMILRNSYTKEDIDKVEKIINALPSESQQMSLWSSLIMRIIPKCKKDDPIIKNLISLYIIPKLSKIKNKNERISAIIDAIVVLYFNDSNLPNLNELPSQKLKDIALSRICKYIFTQCLPEDLCDENYDGYVVDFESIKRVLNLTKLMSNDYFIASQVIEIRKSISSRNTKISTQQRIEVRNEFEKIALEKLPDLNNIRHQGYQLLVKANALSMQSKIKWADWEVILNDINKIPNLSDRIFMWISISELLTDEFESEKQKLINNSINSAYNLPSFLDTVQRIEMVFFTIYKRNNIGIGLKPLLEEFITKVNKNPHSPYLRQNFKNILDVAYPTDPVIAKTLVNSIDSDVARQNTGTYLKNHLNLIELQSKIEKKIGSNKNEQQLLEENKNYFNRIIEKKLSKLNSSKKPQDSFYPKDLLYQLKIASEYSIYDCHNAFAYFIERLIIMYQNTNEADKIIRKSFLELLEVCNLVKLLSIRNADKIKSLLEVLKNENLIPELDLFQIKNELGEEMYDLVFKFLKNGKSVSDISAFLKIDSRIVNAINENSL